jgi:7,8-dihydropterin-6-yl-methyl-4-(beta-D-ribofuranosyl)aminobenzene 5'-phosphate synthase
MKWTVLSDNRSNDSRLFTEHGLSIILQTEKHKILLDTGASDVFFRNAEQLGIDLSDVDYVFISHGHSDHAGGLRCFLEHNRQAKVIVSPNAMSGRFFSKRGNLHSITTEWPEIGDDRLILVKQTCEIDNGIHVIAHIPQNHPMPKGNQNLYVQNDKRRTSENNVVLASTLSSEEEFDNVNGDYIHDDFRHELALYVDGLLFTGCAHSGLENILSACPWPVNTVVGGFHLLDGQETEEELKALAQRLKRRTSESNVMLASTLPSEEEFDEVKAKYPETRFYTSHCTGDNVFEVMKSVMGEQLQSFRCGTIIK